MLMARPSKKSADQKLQIVLSVLRGEATAAEAARRGGVSEQSVHSWKRVFLDSGRDGLEQGQKRRTSRELELEAENEELKAARKEHDEAHEAVQQAAAAAQEAHDLMIQWDKEVNKQRERANSKHRELRNTKQEADKAHRFYIVSLRCLHSIQDMMRARRSAEAGEGERPTARVEVQDLMSKLMSGDTLTTEELMELQRFD